jgi:DNA-binding LacI/PurR family transcriptional regulator
MREIADRLGVSETAVSFAINGRPGISEATRARILDSIKQLGWTPNYAARALSESRSYTVGFVVARKASDVGAESFFLQLMTGLQAVLRTEHYGLLFQVAESVDEEIEVYRRWRAAGRVDGVVVIDLRCDDPRPEALAAIRLPAVLAGGPDPAGLIPSVTIDDVAAVTSVVEHLRGLGHHRIAYVTGDQRIEHIRRRVAAFHDLATAQDSWDVVETDFSTSQAAAAVRRLVGGARRPTALVFENEVLAVAGVGELLEQAVSIPGQVAVVSLEDSLIGTAMRPQLTALHRDTRRFGQDVAQCLLDVIDGRSVDVVREAAPRLVVRGSTRPGAAVGSLASDL